MPRSYAEVLSVFRRQYTIDENPLYTGACLLWCTVGRRRVKHRKVSKGNRSGYATSGAELAYGEFGLKALTRGLLTATQIEACRVAINREMKRKGKLWIRIFPDRPVTRKPIEVGGGKGNPEFWAAVILPGKMLFEIGGVSEEVAKECLRLAATKIGIHTKFVTRAGVKI